MPYDTLVMSAATAEITRALGARVAKIYQPRAMDVVIHLRKPGFDRALLLSASPEASRVQFTTLAIENPKFPPMFCMLLRKHLEGARLSGVERVPFERILSLRFDGRDDMGVPQVYTLLAEMMGRRSNIVLLDRAGVITDALKRSSLDVNQAREVLPGSRYSPPPARARISPLDLEPDTLAAWALEDPSRRLEDVLVDRVAGLGPALSRHVVSVGRNRSGPVSPGLTALAVAVVAALREAFSNHAPTAFSPVVYWDGERPVDYYCFPLDHLSGFESRRYETMSDALDAYYGAKLRADRFQSLQHSLRSAVKRGLDRAVSRLDSQQQDLAEGMKAEQYRLFGELLTAYGARIERSQEVRLPNYYEEAAPEVTIPLNPSMDAQANAQAYFKKYAKAKAAREQAGSRLRKTRAEISYLEQVAETIDLATTEGPLCEIRDELAAEGYIAATDHGRHGTTGRVAKTGRRAGGGGGAGPGGRSGPVGGTTGASEPVAMRSSEGFEILVGRNNRQNDLLWRNAKPEDVWLHAKNVPGAHVILRYSRDAGRPPEVWPAERSLLEAASLAAHHSKGRNNTKVQVDYTLARHVWKPRGAKPGMVLYDHERTIVVAPDPAPIGCTPR
ncbi:MAG: fibronectin/fibrinogen-binding protein [Firmicutes bacterium]|nr:fibronectin/fibrinogen-binding protein [Bacillota bacterium]